MNFYSSGGPLFFTGLISNDSGNSQLRIRANVNSVVNNDCTIHDNGANEATSIPLNCAQVTGSQGTVTFSLQAEVTANDRIIRGKNITISEM